MVIKKTKISTITAAVATIAVMVTMGSIGAIGLGQQQMALAQVLEPGEIGEDVSSLAARIVGGCSAEFENCIDNVGNVNIDDFCSWFSTEFLQAACRE
jgi:hypothetical protein